MNKKQPFKFLFFYFNNSFLIFLLKIFLYKNKKIKNLTFNKNDDEKTLIEKKR